MNCPKCGHDDTRVRETRKRATDEDMHIIRRRKCMQCENQFTTYECYELADVEGAFDLAEVKATILKVTKWMEPSARYIPIIRDARKALLKHA